MIKPINCGENQERLDELQAAISHSILNQISISTTPRTRKLKRKRKNSRETGKEGVLTVNLIDSCLDVLERRRTCVYIGRKIVTVRSFRSTVTMKRSTMDRFENIVAVRSRWTVQIFSSERRYKTPLISSLRSQSNGRDLIHAERSQPL